MSGVDHLARRLAALRADALHQHFRRGGPHGPLLEMDGRQVYAAERCELDVIEPDDRDVVRHVEFEWVEQS